MSPLIRFVLCFVVLFHFATSARAATFNVSPATIANDDPNPFTLNIAGLASQQTVLIERFHDANANGQVDAGEVLLLSFRVTDGKVETFGGVPDPAIPGDADGVTNGQISVSLRLGDLAEGNRLIGNYVFRVSALNASFSPLTSSFVVSQSAQGQTIRGTVEANGSPLPGSVVVALVPDGDGANFIAGVFTDDSGAYALNLPAGDYGLLGFKSGFVSSFNSAPQVSLLSGSTVTQAVVLSSASRTVSGRVIDAVTSNGIGGLQLFAESSSGDVGLANTDAAGNFSLDTGAGQVRMNPSEQGLRLLGYGGGDYTFDTTTGDVTGALIRLSKGRGRFRLAFFFPSGNFGNGTNGNIAFPTQLNYYFAAFDLNDADFPTNVLFTGPSGSGLVNTPSAYYGVNERGDSAYYSSPQVNVPAFPPGGLYTVNYKSQPLDFMLPDPQAQSHQVLLVPRVTLDGQNQITEIRWDRRGTNGNALATTPFITRIQIRIQGQQWERLYEADVSADATSHVPSNAVTWTNVGSIEMAYDDDAGNQYTCFWQRGFSPLQIYNGSNLPSGTVGYHYQTFFAAGGGLPPYTWSLQNGNLPPGLNLAGTGELSGDPSQSGTYNFTVRLTDSNQTFQDHGVTLQVSSPISNVRIEPKVRTPGRFELRVFGQTGQTYTVQYSTDLQNWFPLLTRTAPGNWFDVVDTGANDAARFYRVSQP